MLQGYIHPDFKTVGRLLKTQMPRLRAGGAALCVYHEGEKVIDTWGGTRNREKEPWEEDTLALSYSTTKGIASTLLHILVDRNEVDYSEFISTYWPEFGDADKEWITIRQALCHETGLYDIRSMIDHARRIMDWEHMTNALAQTKPTHMPGTAIGYHGITYGWLIGEIIQRVTGKSFAQVLKDELVDPLGLDGMYVGLPDSEMDRRAMLVNIETPPVVKKAMSFMEDVGMRQSSVALPKLFRRFGGGPQLLPQFMAALSPRGMHEIDFNSPELVQACIPAANGMFTARSLAKMYAMLANGGELDGTRILSEKTVQKATRIQSDRSGNVIPFSMQWRLGYHRVITLNNSIPNGFGHFGFGGSGAWADPERNLSLGLTLNSGVGTPFGDARIVNISTAVAWCADRR
ncbi:MAG: serine hydrolase [Pseudomonadota bacterium]